MDFEPINTQEDFDSRVRELYGDVTDLQQQITTLTGERDTNAQTIADLQNQIKGFQTSALKRQIAAEKGIPAEFADRLTGDDEKTLRKDADSVAATLRGIKGPAPMFDPTKNQSTGKTADMANMLKNLRGE